MLRDVGFGAEVKDTALQLFFFLGWPILATLRVSIGVIDSFAEAREQCGGEIAEAEVQPSWTVSWAPLQNSSRRS